MTTKEKSVPSKEANTATKFLVKEFYKLRKDFETGYSGKLRSYKYEETRAFTIALNYAIFKANQLHLNEANTDVSLCELSATYEAIKKDYYILIE